MSGIDLSEAERLAKILDDDLHAQRFQPPEMTGLDCIDTEDAAKALRDMAAEITRLREECHRLRAQARMAQAQANALDRGLLQTWRDGEVFGRHHAAGWSNSILSQPQGEET